MPAPLVASESPARPAPCEEAPQRLEIHIPLRTICRAADVICRVHAVAAAAVSVPRAVTLNAFVDWLEARGMPRWGSLTVVIGLRDGVSEKHELQKDQAFGDKA